MPVLFNVVHPVQHVESETAISLQIRKAKDYVPTPHPVVDLSTSRRKENKLKAFLAQVLPHYRLCLEL